MIDYKNPILMKNKMDRTLRIKSEDNPYRLTRDEKRDAHFTIMTFLVILVVVGVLSYFHII